MSDNSTSGPASCADQMPWGWSARYAARMVLMWALVLPPTNVLFAVALVGASGVVTTAVGEGSFTELVQGALLIAALSLVLFVGAQTVVLHRPGGDRRLWWLSSSRGWAACQAHREQDGWKLSMLLAAPRRSGLGTELGRHILDAADQEGSALYLEARTRRLERLYAAWGFTTVARPFRARMRRNPSPPPCLSG